MEVVWNEMEHFSTARETLDKFPQTGETSG
jgi:hypothetical protein